MPLCPLRSGRYLPAGPGRVTGTDQVPDRGERAGSVGRGSRGRRRAARRRGARRVAGHAAVTPPVATPATNSAPAASATATSPAPTSTEHPADRHTQDVDWKPCEGSPAHQCTRIEVLVDYAEPDGDTFEVALRKVPPSIRPRRSAPWSSTWARCVRAGVCPVLELPSAKQVREAYDIVGFDPRGIGQSDAVACLTDDDMDLLFENDPTPDDAAEQEKPLGATRRRSPSVALEPAVSARPT